MTAPDDLLERVARAINDGLGEWWAYCNYSGNEWVECRDMLDSAARAAIAEVLKDWPEIERMRLGKQ
jgi:hypothetical protein